MALPLHSPSKAEVDELTTASGSNDLSQVEAMWEFLNMVPCFSLVRIPIQSLHNPQRCLGIPEILPLLRNSQVEAILQRPQDPDEADSTDVTALFAAAIRGRREAVALLLEASASVDMTTPRGITPLFAASENGHVEVVRMLLKAHADKDKATNHGTTPLFVACEEGRVPVVRLLLEARASIDKATLMQTTPLLSACAEGEAEVVKLLLEARADKDRVGPMRFTPLYLASRRGHMEVARMLLEAGAHTNSSFEGRSPLEGARDLGNTGTLFSFIDKPLNSPMEAAALAKARENHNQSHTHKLQDCRKLSGCSYISSSVPTAQPPY